MKYNLKLAIRNIIKQKTGSMINIIGLSLSLAICLIIVLFVQHEFSFDKHNKHYNQIYRLLRTSEQEQSPSHPIVFYKKLKENVPELHQGTMMYFNNKRTEFFKYQENDFLFKGVIFTTPDFFDVFTVRFLQGNPESALETPDKVVLNESTARKLFGNTNAMGQVIRYLNRYDLEVSGIIADQPQTSHFTTEMLISMDIFNTLNKHMTESWNNSSSSFYFLLSSGSNLLDIQNKIKEQYMKGRGLEEMSSSYQLQPLSDLHLYSAHTLWDVAARGDIQVVMAFILIAFFILCIACFNYINLSLALSGKRNIYTGIQKTMGANQKTIFISTLTESIILVTLCAFLAVGILSVLIPGFNKIMGTHLIFLLLNPIILIALSVLIFFSVLIPSIFQSWLRSKINPVQILSGKGRNISLNQNRIFGGVSQSLTIAQLIVSIFLIICVFTINKQTSLLLDQQLGFNKSKLMIIKNPRNSRAGKRLTLFKEQLLKLPEIGGISASWNVPGNNINNYSNVRLDKTSEEDNVLFGQLAVESDYFNVLQSPFILGRGFDASLSSDSNKVVINKVGMEMMGLTDPIGKRIKNFFLGGKECEIIGVVENIQYHSLREQTVPALYFITPWDLSQFVVRINSGNVSTIIQKIKEVWKSIEPDHPFEFRFADQILQSNYEKEIRTKKVLTYMALLAIFISTLGIFGLGTFIAQKRTKEIGIRKVNGAKVQEILTMLNKDFIKWGAIAFVVACPVAWYAMNKWLENFAYKTELSWWIFALAGVLALGIALLTVSWQSWKAATRNPIEALRYE